MNIDKETVELMREYEKERHRNVLDELAYREKIEKYIAQEKREHLRIKSAEIRKAEIRREHRGWSQKTNE